MLAFGALLTVAALLALAAAAIAARSPGAPRWVTASWSGEVITLAIVIAFALGLANLIAGALDAYRNGLGLVDLGLLAAVLCGAFLIWRRLDLRARVRAPAPAPTARPIAPRPATPTVAATPGAPPPPSRPRSRAA